jgi:metal-responsive CopG/Arc/MetJ family transcriptional regulator
MSDPHDTVTVGISMQQRQLDKIDQFVNEREELTEEHVSRSEIVRECALVGLQATRRLDEKFGAEMSVRARMGQTSSALVQYEPEAIDDRDFLVQQLARIEDLDEETIENALRRAHLDDV